jgi:hypothetical protein
MSFRSGPLSALRSNNQAENYKVSLSGFATKLSPTIPCLDVETSTKGAHNFLRSGSAAAFLREKNHSSSSDAERLLGTPGILILGTHPRRIDNG